MTDTARISMLSATSPTISPTRAPTSAQVSSEATRSRDDISSASAESAFEAHLSRAQREDRQQDRQAVQTQVQDAKQQRVERREAAEDKHAQHLEQAQAASSDTSPVPAPATTALQNGNLPPAQSSSASQTAGQPSAQPLEASRLDSSVERGISRMQQLQQLTQGGQGASGSDEAALNATSATTAGTTAPAGAQALSTSDSTAANTAGNSAGNSALQGDWLATLRNPAAAGLDGAIADQAPTGRTSAAAAGSVSADAPSSLTDGALGPLTEEAIEGVTAKADGALLDANGSRAGADQFQLSGASSAGVSPGASSSTAAGSAAMLNAAGSPAGMAQQAGALIPASVGTQAWQQALSEQVVRMQLSKSPQAEIALNPANLGKLTIRLNIGEQGTSAHFVASHQQVRSAVESSLSELRQALESQGHELTAISFSSQDDMQQDDTRDEAPGNSPNQGQFAQHLEGQPANGASTSADAMEGSLAASNLTSNLASASQAAWGQREWQA